MPTAKYPRPSEALKTAAMNVFTARALVETLRPVIKEIQAQVLRENKIIYVDRFAVAYPERFNDADRQPKRLTSFDDAFELPEDSTSKVYELLEQAYIRAGYTEERPVGHCPLLQAESIERRAVDLLIETSQELGLDIDPEKLDRAGSEKRREYAELVLRYVGRFIKTPTAAPG